MMSTQRTGSPTGYITVHRNLVSTSLSIGFEVVISSTDEKPGFLRGYTGIVSTTRSRYYGTLRAHCTDPRVLLLALSPDQVGYDKVCASCCHLSNPSHYCRVSNYAFAALEDLRAILLVVSSQVSPVSSN